MIIIGAGIAGLSLGWQLARRGLPPTVIDAGTIGQGASHAAAGYLQPGLDPSPVTDLEWTSLRATPGFIADLQSETGLDVDFRTDGLLRIGYAGDEAQITADHDARRAAGWQVELMDGAAARALGPGLSPEITIACWLREVSWVDGRKLCAALATAIRARGGQVLENRAALEVTSENGRVTGVNTAQGPMPASRVALAAGHAFDRIAGLPADLPASRPVRGVILTLGMPAPLFTRLIKRPDGILCPRSDGRLIVGVTRVEGDMRDYPDAASVRALLDSAIRATPALADLPLIEAVHGFRPFLPGDQLLFGASDSLAGLYLSMGHGADGYLRMAEVSRRLAEMILTPQTT
ncbi:NAD(P)/FAD-dependent oxidoreductase [Marimonas lutisalis]|uniref:NAD(P)/FAD-dependent oxidoreductase n=1 Tax=Marimonas lutisalis TaxID=2545756 RepID=UPI0010F9BA34|nr:FAD-dependent oxidoreductase [Marimonas lutisalis]